MRPGRKRRPFDVHAAMETTSTTSECGVELHAIKNGVMVDLERFLTMGDVEHLWLRCGDCFRQLFKNVASN